MILSSFPLLMSQGWTHVSNVGSHEEAEEIIEQLQTQFGHAQYLIGEPKPAKYSSEYLMDMGMVGIYTRGGKKVRRAALSDLPPESPIVLAPPQLPDTVKPGVYDRPPTPVYATAA